MSERLTNVAVQLRGERDSLFAEITSLREQLSERETELARVDSALKALGLKPNGKTIRKPAATKEQVVQAIEQVLRQAEPVEAALLRKQVEQQIVNSGNSRMGLALRLKEALQDSRFIDSPSGYRLHSREPAEVATTK